MEKDKKIQTINTYNTKAKEIADKFDKSGARVNDILETFALIQKNNPHVLEIGCANGRDAKEIIKHTNNYLGIDISEKLIELARQKIPKANFQIADIENYILPKKLDIIFAFASLIHIPKEKLEKILSNALSALNTNGIIRLSMKYADAYSEITKEDEFGIRTYYLYSKKDLENLSSGFTIIKSELNNLRNQKWLEIIMKKI